MSTNKYQKPWVEIIEFENEDIITASGCLNAVNKDAVKCTGSPHRVCSVLVHDNNPNQPAWDQGDVRAVQGDEIW